MLAYRSLRMSTSHFMIELYVVSCTPAISMPRKEGWKSASGHRKRSLPRVITWPSGSSYDFSTAEDWAQAAMSASKSSATYASFSLMSRITSHLYSPDARRQSLLRGSQIPHSALVLPVALLTPRPPRPPRPPAPAPAPAPAPG